MPLLYDGVLGQGRYVFVRHFGSVDFVLVYEQTGASDKQAAFHRAGVSTRRSAQVVRIWFNDCESKGTAYMTIASGASDSPVLPVKDVMDVDFQRCAVRKRSTRIFGY